MAPTLRISDLREAAERLLNEAERRFGSEIDLGDSAFRVGMYWDVSLDQAYTLVDRPELDIGDVVDDVQEVLEMSARDDHEVYLWHDLSHLCGVLRAVAYFDLPTKA